MQLLPNQYLNGDVPGWYTDDDAKLYFFNQTTMENPDRRENPAPASISASVIGRVGEPVNIPIADLTYIGAGLFGEARPSISASIKWSGDSYKFGIYLITRYNHTSVVIVRQDGSGRRAYQLEGINLNQAWQSYCTKLSSPELWDLCKLITDSYNNAMEQGKRQVEEAFLQGNLKKVRGKNRVEYKA